MEYSKKRREGGGEKGRERLVGLERKLVPFAIL